MRKAATLIEMIITVLIIGVLAAVGSSSIVFLVQLFIYSPRQLDVQKVAETISNTVMEGNPDVRGLRYTRSVIDASDSQFSYVYGYPNPADQLSVRFRWDETTKHIYKSTRPSGSAIWSSEETVPYQISSSTTIEGKDTSTLIFDYKKAGDVDWVSGTDALADIRRVILEIKVETGTGNFTNFQGASEVSSSAEIKGFQ